MVWNFPVDHEPHGDVLSTKSGLCEVSKIHPRFICLAKISAGSRPAAVTQKRENGRNGRQPAGREKHNTTADNVFPNGTPKCGYFLVQEIK